MLDKPFGHFNGAKPGVAPVARVTPLFLPHPEFMYINMLHISAPPRTYLICAPPVLSPDWRQLPNVLELVTEVSMSICTFFLSIFKNGHQISTLFSANK